MARVRHLPGIRHLGAVPGWIEDHPRPVGAGAIAVLLVLSYAVFVGLPGLSTPPGAEVRAVFAPAGPEGGSGRLLLNTKLLPGSPVRVGGVNVGKTVGVELADDGVSRIVTMRVAEVRVRRDASARIVWRTLLGGNLAIDLDPGSSSSPPLGEQVIPEARTGSQVEFDDLFLPFRRTTRAHVRDLIRGLRRGFSNESATRRALDVLGPATRTAARGLRPLNGTRPNDLRRLVGSTGRVVDALDDRPDALTGLVRGADRTLAVTAARRAELGATIELTPAALEATVAAVRRLDPTLDELDPLARRLRPGVRRLAPAATAATPALRQANALLAEARPLLRDVGPTFGALKQAARSGVPLVKELEPTIARLNGDLLPFLATENPDTKLKVYETLGPWFSVVGQSTLFDDNGYFFVFPNASKIPPDAGPSPCATDLSGPQLANCKSLSEILATVLATQPPEAR